MSVLNHQKYLKGRRGQSFFLRKQLPATTFAAYIKYFCSLYQAITTYHES